MKNIKQLKRKRLIVIRKEYELLSKGILEQVKPSRVTYSDGTVHQPQIYLLKNGATLIKKPPKKRSIEPIINFTLKTSNSQIIKEIKNCICGLLPYTPNEIETNISSNKIKLKVNLPTGYYLEPYSFAERLKRRSFVVSNVLEPFIIFESSTRTLKFLGNSPRLTNIIKSNIIIEKGTFTGGYNVNPHRKGKLAGYTEIIVTIYKDEKEEKPDDKDEAKTAFGLRKGQNKKTIKDIKKYLIKGFSLRDVISLFRKKYEFSYKDILNFIKLSIVQKASTFSLIERSLYFVYNSSKTASYYPKTKRLAVGSDFIDHDLKFKFDKEENVNIIDLELKRSMNIDEINLLNGQIATIDNSVFWIVDNKGKKSKFKVIISDSTFQKLFDNRIENILKIPDGETLKNRDTNEFKRKLELFNDIARFARLAAKIEMMSEAPNELNKRTLKNLRYYVQKATEKFVSLKIRDFELTEIFEEHRDDLLYPETIKPRAPKNVFALIKEEKVGLKYYPVFSEYLEMLDPDEHDWEKIYERRIDIIKNGFAEVSEEDAKKVIEREIEGHKNKPTFAKYVARIKKEFADYLND